MTSEYRIRRRVHFYETDAAGIVHFSWYPRYMEEAENALWREAGLSIGHPESGVGWPRVAVSFEYFRPLRFEDEFEIRIAIVSIGEKRIEYRARLVRGDTQIASGRMTVSCVRRNPDGTMKSAPIPPEVRERFEVADTGDWGGR